MNRLSVTTTENAVQVATLLEAAADGDEHAWSELVARFHGDSITVFSTAVIGGLGSVSGAISGVLLFRWLETLTFLGDLRLVVNGAGLLFVLYALPGGLGQWLFAGRDAFVRWAARRRGIEVDQAAAAAGSTLLEDAAPDRNRRWTGR